MTYEEVRAHLCEMYPGLIPADVDEMSFEMIDSCIRRGKKPEGIPIRSEEEVLEIAREWRKYYGV